MSSDLNLLAGWSSFFLGAASGAVIGLFFHRDDWLGGYGSFPRRLLRLGHIAFFGLGLINILFALSLRGDPASAWRSFASLLLIVGAATMPLTCFLTAWRKPFRHAFVVPAGATLAGLLCTLVHLISLP